MTLGWMVLISIAAIFVSRSKGFRIDPEEVPHAPRWALRVASVLAWAGYSVMGIVAGFLLNLLAMGITKLL